MLCKKYFRGKSLMKFLMDLIFERIFGKNAEGTGQCGINGIFPRTKILFNMVVKNTILLQTKY